MAGDDKKDAQSAAKPKAEDKPKPKKKPAKPKAEDKPKPKKKPAKPKAEDKPKPKKKSEAEASALRKAAQDAKGAEGQGGHWVDFVFGPRRGPEDRIVLFHHIRKTAGTSLKDTIAKNVPDGRKLRVIYPDASTEEVRAWWQETLGSLTSSERETLWAVSSHSAGFGMNQLPGPSIGITMLRDPVDQVLSRWFMRKSARDPEARDVEDLRALYQRGESQRDTYYNPQARTLLEPHYDVAELAFSLGPPPDANLWRERLFSLVSKRFLVGLQDAYQDSLRLFSEELEWTNLEPATAKVNPYRPREFELDAEMADLLRQANWLDMELYSEYARAFGTIRRVKREEATGKLAYKASGYVIESNAPKNSEDALRSELESVRSELAEANQALRLRLRAAEIELQHLRADMASSNNHPKSAGKRQERSRRKQEATEKEAAKSAERDQRRKNAARRKTLSRLRGG